MSLDIKSVELTQTQQPEYVIASRLSQEKAGIRDYLLTITLTTPPTHPMTQFVSVFKEFVSAAKDQILTCVRTVRIYILCKQLNNDTSQLNTAIKDADLNLLEGLIELFQKRWDKLDLQAKKQFFIGLFNNENYLRAYQLAYEKGIPFNLESSSSQGDQKSHIFSHLVHEQPPLIERGSRIALAVDIIIHPKTAQLLQYFSKIENRLLLEELKQIPKCCPNCSHRYELVFGASTATNQEKLTQSDHQLIKKALSSSDAKEADQIIKNLLDNEYRFKSAEERRMIFTAALEKGWTESAQIMISNNPHPDLTALLQKLGPQLMKKALSSSDAKEADQVVKTLVTIGYTRFFPDPELKKEIVLKACENQWLGTLQVMNEHHPEVVEKFIRPFL